MTSVRGVSFADVLRLKPRKPCQKWRGFRFLGGIFDAGLAAVLSVTRSVASFASRNSLSRAMLLRMFTAASWYSESALVPSLKTRARLSAAVSGGPGLLKGGRAKVLLL